MATLRPADMVDTFLVLFLVMVAVQSSLFLLKVLKFLVLRFFASRHPDRHHQLDQVRGDRRPAARTRDWGKV